MVYRLRRHPFFDADVPEVLAYTKKEWGTAKKAEYQSLLREAQILLREAPGRGVARPDIHPQARVLHIGRPGRRAAHVILYVIRKDHVLLVGLLHEAMDLPRHFPANLDPTKFPKR